MNCLTVHPGKRGFSSSIPTGGLCFDVFFKEGLSVRFSCEADDLPHEIHDTVKDMEDLYHRPIQIGSCRIENSLALAPMAGITEVTYRRICHRFGAGLVVTELVSASGIRHDPHLRHQLRYLEISPDEKPVAIQLFGSDPDDFAIATECVLSHPLLSGCSLIDINAGCPVRKVAGGGSGSGLLLDPERLESIVRRCVSAATPFGVPVTVKIRLGWDRDRMNATEVAKRLENAGAEAIFVHGRTRDQMYSGTADWQAIAAVKASVGIPVYGNGDVVGPEDARRMILETGVDGVMIGRAAIGNPWLFREAAAVLAGEEPAGRPSIVGRIPVILEHVDGLIARYGEVKGVREMRKHLARYLSGYPGASLLRKSAMAAETRSEVEAVLVEWYRETDQF